MVDQVQKLLCCFDNDINIEYKSYIPFRFIGDLKNGMLNCKNNEFWGNGVAMYLLYLVLYEPDHEFVRIISYMINISYHLNSSGHYKFTYYPKIVYKLDTYKKEGIDVKVINYCLSSYLLGSGKTLYVCDGFPPTREEDVHLLVYEKTDDQHCLYYFNNDRFSIISGSKVLTDNMKTNAYFNGLGVIKFDKHFNLKIRTTKLGFIVKAIELIIPLQFKLAENKIVECKKKAYVEEEAEE